MTELVLNNARVVTAETDFLGAVLVRDGWIAEILDAPLEQSGSTDSRVDCHGDLLVPGLVELHTDNLERHLAPRPGARWPAVAAVVAHDAQVVASGITTVFDAIAVGDIDQAGQRRDHLEDAVAALDETRDRGLTKADHILHLRCEVSVQDMRALLEPLLDAPSLKLMSVMDHSPGQRQFVKLDHYRRYYQNKLNLSDAEIDRFIEGRVKDREAYSVENRAWVVEQARARAVRLASHDDASPDHVSEAVADGMTIAEFPTTVAAARASHENGLAVMMGGPNLVRGGSHSGNVSARDLAEHGYLDVISSDYAPISLLHGAMILAEEVAGFDLAKAIATVTSTPARAAGLDDRGEIAVGKRADFVRVEHTPHHPLIRSVWRAGERIA